MQTVKLKAHIGADATVKWLEPCTSLPTGEVEIIVLYDYGPSLVELDSFDKEEATTDRDDATPSMWENDQDITDPEWLALTPQERAGWSKRNLTPEEKASRLQWIDNNAGRIALPLEQAMEIAMDPLLAEENLEL